MLAKFGHCFSAAAQEQGAALCQQGLVRAIYGSERELRVEILDCSGAEATWRISRNRLQPSCTCQSFHSGGLCAHLWGALLLAEQQGDLALARRKCVSSKIDLVPIAPAVTDLELSYQPLEPVSSRRLRAAAVRSSEGEEEPRFVPLRRKERRPIPIGPELDLSLAGPEILYVLSEERFSPEDDFLCLESWWRQSGVGGRASCRPFYPEGESLVSESRDARTLTLLLQHNLLPAEKSGNLFTVKNPALREFFLLQAGSSSLRWRQRGIRQGEQWQKLQIPGEYAAEFAYSFHRNPQGQYETQITLQTAEGSFQLAEIVCLG